MHATLQLSTVEELPSAQQRIYVLSVTSVTIHDDDSSIIATANIHDFQMSKKLSFPIIILHDDNGNGSSSSSSSIDNNSHPTITINRLIEALQCGNHKLILRVWKKGARWWNLNMNHTQTSSSSCATTTLSMAKSEVAGYRLAKLAMDHHLEQANSSNSGKKKNKIIASAHVPHVVYFSHDNGNINNTTDDSWALFSYFDKIEGEINTTAGGGSGGNVNIINHSSLKLDCLNRLTTQTTTAIQQPFSSSSSSSSDHNHNNNYHNMKQCCNHYPTTMTKSRHEFGFDEPHPRHGRVPIDECFEYAQMILRDVVLPIQFSFFEWSSSSSLTTPDGYINCNSVEWTHNLCTLGIDRQKVKPYHYHDMIAVHRDALERLSTAHHNATTKVVVDDERMGTLLQMMEKCVNALEHEWDDDENHDGCGRPPPLPAVLCHMDLQPQNLTFWHDRNEGNDENNANDHIHVSQHCSVASVMDFEEAAYADPRFEVLLICRKVLANKFQAEELWKSYAIRVKMETTWDVGPIEPWLRLETVHSLLTLLLQANDLLGGGRNPWETKPDLIAKIDRERRRLVNMNWSFCSIKDEVII
jgi:thiamine kinase-like enzyme